MTVDAVAHAWSLLFVPGDRPDRFQTAVDSGADVVIVDLEDAVASKRKESALGNLLRWLSAGHEAVVRVNGVGTPWYERELESLRNTEAVVMIPKAQSPADLAAAHATLGRNRRILGLIETARGVQNADDLAAVPGVMRLALGNVDLSTELGVRPDSNAALSYSRSRLVVAATSAGLEPSIDGVTTDLVSSSILASDLAVTRELGFGGKLCIHPRQVGAVNSMLSPTEAELEWARRVLTSSNHADGVSSMNDAMVDRPVVLRAERILALSSRFLS
jgi:citrate lyase subunit beta/citryl-CoA lyase